jgi:hypothetical protein
MLSATRLFMLFQLLLFASVIASITNSDLLGRDETTVRRVTPTDPHNATKIAETEIILKKQSGEVQSVLDKDGLPIWLITSTQDDILASLELIEGVRSVTTDPQASLPKREGGGGPRALDLVEPAVTKWMILAKEGSDLKKTEAFLNTQTEHGTELYEIGIEGSARGWGNANLTSAAKAVVEKYDGVAAMAPEGELESYRALPVRESIQDSSLTSRDTTWQNQVNADKSLLMDS